MEDDSSSSSIWEFTNSWQNKAEESLRITADELSRPKVSPRHRTAKVDPTQTKLVTDDKSLQTLPKAQITETTVSVSEELSFLETLRGQQQSLFEEQLIDKKEFWERTVLERRQEVITLRSVIDRLSLEIGLERTKWKKDISEAKDRSRESELRMRQRREEQLQTLTDLTVTLENDRQEFAVELKQIEAANEAEMELRRERIARLNKVMENVGMKGREKWSENEGKFKGEVRNLREMRKRLQNAREFAREKQSGLLALREDCAKIARMTSTANDQTAALRRQLATLVRDNNELQMEIVRMESGLFPTAFPSIRP
jgi:hypothetical protein